jgi:hypothetical protein
VTREYYVQILKEFPGLPPELVGKVISVYRIVEDGGFYLASTTVPPKVFKGELFPMEFNDIPPIPFFASALLVDKPEDYFLVRLLDRAQGEWYEDLAGREFVCVKKTPTNYLLPLAYEKSIPTSSVQQRGFLTAHAAVITHPGQELRVTITGCSHDNFWYKDDIGVSYPIARILEDAFAMEKRPLEGKEPVPGKVYPPPGNAKTVLVAPMILMRDCKPQFEYVGWSGYSEESMDWEYCDNCGYPSKYLINVISEEDEDLTVDTKLCSICNAMESPEPGFAYMGNIILEAIAETQEDPTVFLATFFKNIAERHRK